MLIVIVFISQLNIFSVKIDENQNDVLKNLKIKITSPKWNFTYEGIDSNNNTVATFLMECSKNYNFSIETKFLSDYESFFIESINGIKNGEDNRFWQYYVNGEYADIGCSSYILHSGDIVEWQFETSKW